MNKFAAKIYYKAVKNVAKEYPAAVKIIAVVGGWMVFDPIQDFEIWKKQK